MLEVTRFNPAESAVRPKTSWYSEATNDCVCTSDVLLGGGGAVPAPAVLLPPELPDELVLPACRDRWIEIADQRQRSARQSDRRRRRPAASG